MAAAAGVVVMATLNSLHGAVSRNLQLEPSVAAVDSIEKVNFNDISPLLSLFFQNGNQKEEGLGRGIKTGSGFGDEQRLWLLAPDYQLHQEGTKKESISNFCPKMTK